MDEEKKLDEAALKVRTPEEIRTTVITDFGFDETADKDRIDKIVAKEIEGDKKLSGAIGAKIKHRTRAEELEKAGGVKQKEPENKENKSETMSSTDLYALMNAKVAEEDISIVREYSELKKIPIADALKATVVITMLGEAVEARRVAAATHTGGARRGSQAPSGNEILAQAKGGQVPDDDAGMDALVDARMGSKKARK